MASYAPNMKGSIFEELPSLNPAAQDVYGCLLNNGFYVFQPKKNMHLDVIKATMGWYFSVVCAVYIQSPQATYIDIYIGDEPVSPEFKKYFLSGIHRAFFPDTLDRDCYVVFHPLQEFLCTYHFRSFLWYFCTFILCECQWLTKIVNNSTE